MLAQGCKLPGMYIPGYRDIYIDIHKWVYMYIYVYMQRNVEEYLRCTVRAHTLNPKPLSAWDRNAYHLSCQKEQAVGTAPTLEQSIFSGSY